MYHVSVQQDFIAQHFMIGAGDWGEESDLHSHHYIMEVELGGAELNEDGQLMDVNDLLDNVDQRVEYFREQTINELAPFDGVNPTTENFARILCEEINKEIYADNVETLMVRLWENESTWASYQLQR